jgi:hypothetical protein
VVSDAGPDVASDLPIRPSFSEYYGNPTYPHNLTSHAHAGTATETLVESKRQPFRGADDAAFGLIDALAVAVGFEPTKESGKNRGRAMRTSPTPVDQGACG